MPMLHLPLFMLLLLCFSPPQSMSLPWPFSSSSSSPPSASPPPNQPKALKGRMPEFSMEGYEDRKATELVEKARNKLLGPYTCWHDAYRNLFAACSEILTDEDKKKRLAWHLSDCFQKDSGRPNFPSCHTESPMSRCLKNLDDSEHKVYLEFFLETESICHRLQAIAFKHDTEMSVNELAKSARSAVEKLETIEERSEELLQGSAKIQDSLVSLDLQVEQVVQASSDVEARIHDVLKHSEVIYEHSKGISASQSELREGQIEMKEQLESSLAGLQKSYESLGNEMQKLKSQAVEIEREIKEVGDSVSSKMQNLQSTADHIENVAGVALEKQKMLLDGQTVALEGLDFLRKFQLQAIEESRESLQSLADVGHKQQEETLRRQESILANQEKFESKQEKLESKYDNIFAALDKLFALHNAILFESRFIKAFFFYFSVIFLLYMLTSAKQMFDIRGLLYLELGVIVIIELMIKLAADDFNQQSWIESKVFLARSSFLVLAAIQILHSFFTYRDYKILNHQMLQTLDEKVCLLQTSVEKVYMMGENSDSDASLSDYSWIDDELPEEVDSKIDPDYMMDYMLREEVGENSVSTMRKYDLRPRSRRSYQ